MKVLAYLFCLLSVFSCVQDTDELNALSEIEEMGDQYPTLALEKLDSLRLPFMSKSTYLKNKYKLLETRLKDKAYIIPESDSLIIDLVAYFENHGTLKDKRDAYYYAGSTYRDLHDSPRALTFFLKSLEVSQGMDTDYKFQRRVYSNLNWQYHKVQDFVNALDMAKKEYEAIKHYSHPDITACIHLAASYRYNDIRDSALKYFDKALLTADMNGSDDTLDALYILLMQYSSLGEIERANKCFALIKQQDANFEFGKSNKTALANYYKLSGLRDSAILYNQQVINGSAKLEDLYEATRALFYIYSQINRVDSACYYAAQYIIVNDSLNLGERQKLAATVNNEFQYHRNKEEELTIKAENEKMHIRILIVCFVFLLATTFGIIYNLRFRNKQYAKIANLTDTLSELKRGISQREQQIKESEETLNLLNQQIADYDSELKEKERELAEKTKQTNSIIGLLHHSEIQASAEDVIEAIEKSSNTAQPLTKSEWTKLFQSVDAKYPLFKEELFTIIKKHVSEQEMQVFYLMFLGMSNVQIRNLTGMQHVTVWRWTKKFAFISDMARRSAT